MSSTGKITSKIRDLQSFSLISHRHPSIRWTVDELRRMNLVGVPLHVSHDTEELPPVGKVLSSYIDDKTGNLHIIGEIRGNDVVGQTMIDMLDKARLLELIQFNTSLGGPLLSLKHALSGTASKTPLVFFFFFLLLFSSSGHVQRTFRGLRTRKERRNDGSFS